MQIQIEEIKIEVTLKKVKNLNLRVYPPNGDVRISAPYRVRVADIEHFAASKLDWIRAKQRQMRQVKSEPKIQYVEGELFSVWGRQCRLVVSYVNQTPSIELREDEIVMQIRPTTNRATREAMVDALYRHLVKLMTAEFATKWEPKIGLPVKRIYVQRMKTRWGTCNPRAQSIRLNSELGKKPLKYLDYVVLHEMVHFLERSHNEVFQSYMHQFMPDWRQRQSELNQRENHSA